MSSSNEWRIAENAPAEFIELFSKSHPIITQLLYNRTIENQNSADTFFNPDYAKLHDPFLFKDMKKAVDRIWQAIESKEKILIHGDYDADGVTSAATLYRTLKILQADVEAFIPHREKDGYGINPKNIKDFIEKGTKLLITVDCGITNFEEIKELHQAGVDVVVTDHHEPPENLPEAVALIDPKLKECEYPFRFLSGAGVAFKVVQALLDQKDKVEKYQTEFLEWGGVEGFKKWLLDIVAIGTVADVMPLIDENRILVKWGLLVLAKTRNMGLKQLLQIVSGGDIGSYTIGFQIAPRLNAAGRMDHARDAFELLTTDYGSEADRLSRKLKDLNVQRQKVTEIAVSQARNQLAKQEESDFLVVYDKSWEPGVVGLIAGRLCEEFYRPIIAMTETMGRIVGSGRSVEDFDITQSLHHVSECLDRFGGHSQACGFTLASLDVLEEFKKKIKEKTKPETDKLNFERFLTIDAEIKIKDMSFPFLEMLAAFEPFGEGNAKPLFKIAQVQVAAIDTVGKDKSHLRIAVKQDAPRVYKMMWFRAAGEWLSKLAVGDIIDVACELGINEWNGRKNFEFKIVDVKKN